MLRITATYTRMILSICTNMERRRQQSSSCLFIMFERSQRQQRRRQRRRQQTTTEDDNRDQVNINFCSSNQPKGKTKKRSFSLSKTTDTKNKNPQGKSTKITTEFRVETRGSPQTFTATLNQKSSLFDFSNGAAAPLSDGNPATAWK